MKISVIVPVYKTEKYLRQCIDSLLNQDYLNCEIILVDDGSPDNCGRICDKYAEKHARVFSHLRVKENRVISKLSKLSFSIYLLHAGVWDILKKIVHLMKGKDFLVLHADCAAMIPILVLIVSISSIIAAQAYDSLYDRFIKVRSIS